MNVILVLVGFSLVVALAGLIAFFWSVRTGQYDDPYGSSVRILFDDEKPNEPGTVVPCEKEDPTNQI